MFVFWAALREGVLSIHGTSPPGCRVGDGCAKRAPHRRIRLPPTPLEPNIRTRRPAPVMTERLDVLMHPSGNGAVQEPVGTGSAK